MRQNFCNITCISEKIKGYTFKYFKIKSVRLFQIFICKNLLTKYYAAEANRNKYQECNKVTKQDTENCNIQKKQYIKNEKFS